MPARIWYLPIDGPDKPPRIVRIDLASVGWADAVRQPEAGTAFQLAHGRIADAAGVLPAGRKARLDSLLAAFERPSGHPLLVVKPPSLGGVGIAAYAAAPPARRGTPTKRQSAGQGKEGSR